MTRQLSDAQLLALQRSGIPRPDLSERNNDPTFQANAQQGRLEALGVTLLTCADCGKSVPRASFAQRYCVDCRKVRARARVNQRAKLRPRIRPAMMDALIDAQQGICASCGDWLVKGSAVADMVAGTETIRGIVCLRCKTGLGCFGHDPAVIREVLAYLELTVVAES